jgi:hypothetical protein
VLYDGLFGMFLQSGVDGGIDFEPVGIDVIGAAAFFSAIAVDDIGQFFAQVFAEVGS